MTNGDILLGETTRRETLAWLVRFVGWALLASVGVGIVVGAVVALAGNGAGPAMGCALAAGFLTVAVMCIATSGPMPSEIDVGEDEVVR
jgi:hypothetical protein